VSFLRALVEEMFIFPLLVGVAVFFANTLMSPSDDHPDGEPD
jgi:hypothetical protein